MKQIVILSGKGGTGKTSVAAALAHLASCGCSTVLADADVDAANLDLLLSPSLLEEHVFMGGQVAIIEQNACTGCGRCLEVCRFDAVEKTGQSLYSVDPIACEGCASCFQQCPSGAITMKEQHAGNWFHSNTRFGPLFHARLGAAQENSGKLVTTVKNAALELAGNKGSDLVIVDGPPGIGCPVIAACASADLALLVVEPTVSGIHDLERILATVKHFGITPAVSVNKSDINPKHTEAISRFCSAEGIELIGRIPFDTVVTESMTHALTVTEYAPDSAVSLAIMEIYGKLNLLIR